MRSLRYIFRAVFSRIACICFFVALSGVLPCFCAIRVDLSAKSAILINAETGRVLYEKNGYTPMYPASITKVLTALYALEKKGDALDEWVVASPEAVAAVHPHIRRDNSKGHPPYRLEFGGTHIGIKAGEVLSLRTLLYGLMLASGNDAANVIAHHVSGSISQFIQELNGYVRSKGCHDTFLFTPHGLPHPEHKTTAYDMAKLTQIAMQNPFFREVVKTTQYLRPATDKQLESEFHQHNALVKPGKFYYPKATGVKTGYTAAGGYTLVASAEDGHRKLIAVLLGYEHLQERYRDAIALFEAAFHEPRVSRTLFSKQFDLFSYSLHGAKKAVQAALPDDVILSYYPSEEPQFQAVIEWESLLLPIPPGKIVGKILVKELGGRVLVQMPLFSTQCVEPTLTYRFELFWRACRLGIRHNMGWVMGAIGTAILSLTFLFLHFPRKRKAGKQVEKLL